MAGAALAALAGVARADVRFGAHDVRTIFFISKSDDQNRVDYGVRLDAACQPVGARPLYAYWHRFEPGQPPVGPLNGLDRRAYGIARQEVRTIEPGGAWIEMRLAGFPEERILVLVRREGERCVARAQLPIDTRDAYLDNIHVHLGAAGVDRVTLRGRDVRDGRRLVETRRPPRPATLFGN